MTERMIATHLSEFLALALIFFILPPYSKISSPLTSARVVRGHCEFAIAVHSHFHTYIITTFPKITKRFRKIFKKIFPTAIGWVRCFEFNRVLLTKKEIYRLTVLTV